MIDQPKFDRRNPKTKEEKLIVELVTLLDEITQVFIKTNFTGNITMEQFKILRDGSIAYAGAMIRDLGKVLSDKRDIKPFINDAKDIYLAYIEDLGRNLKIDLN